MESRGVGEITSREFTVEWTSRFQFSGSKGGHRDENGKVYRRTDLPPVNRTQTQTITIRIIDERQFEIISFVEGHKYVMRMERVQ